MASKSPPGRGSSDHPRGGGTSQRPRSNGKPSGQPRPSGGRPFKKASRPPQASGERRDHEDRNVRGPSSGSRGAGRPSTDRREERRPYPKRYEDRKPGEAGRGERKPFSPRGGAGKPGADRREERKPYPKRYEDRKSGEAGHGERKPFAPRGGAGRPSTDRREERKPYPKRYEDRKPGEAGRGERKPFVPRGGAGKPGADRREERKPYPNRPAPGRGDVAPGAAPRPVAVSPGPDRPVQPLHTSNLRGKAALLLEEVLDRRQSLKRVLQREQERLQREDDRALLKEMVSGVVRHLSLVDRVLSASVKRGLFETQSELLHILRVGVFQILFLERVPLYAAVDQCVEAAKPLNPGAGGFVNGILRAVADGKEGWLALPEGHDAEAVTLRTGMPPWLVHRYLDRFGLEMGEKILAALQNPAPTALVFPSEAAHKEAAPILESEGWTLAPDGALPLTFTVGKGNPAFSEAFKKGLFYIMDPASQGPAALVPLKGGERVLDLCAAPGGKTILLSHRLKKGGWVLSTDVNRRRLNHLKENIGRLQLANVRMAQVDVEAPLPFVQAFDVVVLDAPCSSMGTLRRNPEIRWQVAETDLAWRTIKQVAFLDKAAAALVPGGTLVYSVCSIEQEETTAVIASFLENHREFSAVKFKAPAGWKNLLTKAGPGQVYLLPHLHSWDAFFVAVLRKGSADSAAEPEPEAEPEE